MKNFFLALPQRSFETLQSQFYYLAIKESRPLRFANIIEYLSSFTLPEKLSTSDFYGTFNREIYDLVSLEISLRHVVDFSVWNDEAPRQTLI